MPAASPDLQRDGKYFKSHRNAGTGRKPRACQRFSADSAHPPGERDPLSQYYNYSMASPIQQGDEVRFRGDFHERIFQLLETVDGYRNFLEAAHLGCCGLGRVYRGGDVPKWRNNSGTAKGRQKPGGGQGGGLKK